MKTVKNNKIPQKCRSISVPVFAILWLAVCSVTAVAAFRFPVRYGTNEVNYHSKRVPVKNGYERNCGRIRFSAIPYLFEGIFGTDFSGGFRTATSKKNETEEIITMLCDFLSDGRVETAKKIFPVEVIDALIGKYSIVIDMLGGEDAAMKYALSRSLLAELGMKGQIRSVNFEILDTTELNQEELVKIKKQLVELKDGNNEEVKRGYKLNINLQFNVENTDGEIESKRVKKEFILYKCKAESRFKILPLGILPKGLIS